MGGVQMIPFIAGLVVEAGIIIGIVITAVIMEDEK